MKNIILILITLFVFASCDLFTGGEGNDTHDQIVISTSGNIALVGDTVYFYEEEADTVATTGKPAFLGKKVKDIGYDVVLAANILAVNVEGHLVHANDIVISGNTAYIAYNYAGDPFRGAIQIVDITHKGEPEILQELLLPSMDVNALYVDGSDLVFGGAADPDIWGFKSFVAKINTQNISPTEIAASVTQLPSHAVTGIAKKSGSYKITVGAEGGKLVTLSDDFSTQTSMNLPDGRDIEEYQNGVIVIAGSTDHAGTDGKVALIPANDTISVDIPIADFGSNYHKATIEVFEGTTALLALSEAGFKVMNLNNETIIYEAENPEIEDGLSYTNSVSSDGNLVFSANGEWGFRVFSVSGKKFDEAILAGYYPYEGITDSSGQNYSANHVEFKSNHLFVASGVGGVQVFTLDKK
ncbi:MAG: hypothetical protein KAH15_00240 [Candidatus Marinimicrobia bacterium]|nr:hypothetical protein [Candidatus Neomarinimicrobiota bacterium]